MNKDTIIVDIDGTIADIDHRLHHIKEKPKDYKAFYSNVHYDKPIMDMLITVRAFNALGYNIVFCTGRKDSCREDTEDWLDIYFGFNFELLMLPSKGHSPDNEGKPLLIAEDYPVERVLFILEDRSRMVKAWRDLGYRCLQVCEGDY